MPSRLMPSTPGWETSAVTLLTVMPPTSTSSSVTRAVNVVPFAVLTGIVNCRLWRSRPILCASEFLNTDGAGAGICKHSDMAAVDQSLDIEMAAGPGPDCDHAVFLGL